MTTESVIECGHLWQRPWRDPILGAACVGVDRNGRISAVEATSATGDGAGRHLLVPGAVNAHDHGRALRPLAYGTPDERLEPWLWGLRRSPSADPYVMAAVAFGRMVRAGITSVVHCHAPMTDDAVAEAGAVARAARDVGLRVGYAVPLVDRNLAGYDGKVGLRGSLSGTDWAALQPWLATDPIADQLDKAKAIVDRYACGTFDVQLGPAAIHWVSDDGLRQLGALAAERKLRVHMHILETVAQRAWYDGAYPDGLVEHLDRCGLLNERLTLAHGVFLRTAELEALAAAGVRLVLNTSSNMRLRSGLVPAADIAASGIRLGIGLDGMALDDDDDMFRELRLATMLHGARGERFAGLEEGSLVEALFASGRAAVDGVTPDGIATGQDADLVALDLDHIAPDRIAAQAGFEALVRGRWQAAHVRDVWVGGRRVVADGTVMGVDLIALEEQLRKEAAGPRNAADRRLIDKAAGAARHHDSSR